MICEIVRILSLCSYWDLQTTPSPLEKSEVGVYPPRSLGTRGRIRSGTPRCVTRRERKERRRCGPSGRARGREGRERSIAEVGRGNRYVSAVFYAAYYFISSVAVVNLRSQPQTSPVRRRGRLYRNFIR